MISIRKSALFLALLAAHASAASAEVKEISFGESVELKDYIAAGKTTVFDFYSEYCGPCRALSSVLERLAGNRSDLLVVKVNINRPDISGIDWTSPVAERYGITGVPLLVIYNPEGKMTARGHAARLQVSAWAKQAKNESAGD